MSHSESHIETSQIVDYVAERLADRESIHVELHLSGCLECARRVKSHRRIKENFDEVWDSWTAGEALRSRAAHALVLSLGRTRHAALKGRIERWLDKLRAKAGIAWCAAVDTSTRTTRVLRLNLQERLSAETPTWLRTGGLQPEPVRTRGAVRTRGSRKAEVAVSAEGREVVKKVDILEGPRGCTVRVLAAMQEVPWPLVALIDKTGEKTFVSPLEKRGEDLSAEFEEVPEGDYRILLEG